MTLPDDDFRDHTPPDLPARLTAVLGRPETWVAAPSDLEGDVLAALRRARDGAVPAAEVIGPEVIDLADRREGRRQRSRRGGARQLAGLAAAAAVAAVVATGTIAVVTRPPGPDAEVVLQATPLAPQASGRAAIRDTPSGFSVDLDIDGLPPSPAGTYYQAWLKNADDDLVTIGTFHGREGSRDILLWSGVDPQDYPTLTVTLQSEGAGAASSGEVVLRGTVG